MLKKKTERVIWKYFEEKENRKSTFIQLPHNIFIMLAATKENRKAK